MKARISRPVLQRIIADAAAFPGEEICGLLFGAPQCIDAAKPCANVAADRSDSFEIDPAALLAAHKAARAGGPRVVGHYHSHPNGLPRPSPRDVLAAAPDGAYWLIVGGGEARLWRARIDGQGFDPVELEAAPGCAQG
ncbi:MAG TPA: M67 family metallopeptidase [Sphingomonas sp.]|nr:M67 family metallopeptidase [Sphingomonas sp.]